MPGPSAFHKLLRLAKKTSPFFLFGSQLVLCAILLMFLNRVSYLRLPKLVNEPCMCDIVAIRYFDKAHFHAIHPI
jgi:hypothetical protein